MSDLETPQQPTLRDQAIKRLKKRRDFHAHLLIYVLFNTIFVVIWAMATPDIFFWPVFPIAFWGIGVVMNGWDVYLGQDFDEDRINREMEHLQRKH